MKSHRLWINAGIITTLIVLGTAGTVKAQTVSVVQTNADQSALLQSEPSVAFSVQGDLPFSIHVDDSIRYQKMDGFGASFTDSSAWLVWTKLTPSQRNTLMQNLFTSSGAGLNFLRQPMGATDLALTEYTYDDMPPGQTDPNLTHFSIDHDKAYIIPILQQALALNPSTRVMALPWSPPAWMKTNDNLRSGSFDSQYLESLNQYFLKFIQAYRNNGIPTHFVAVQNEPLFAGNGYPTLFLTEPQEAEFIAEHLGPSLERLGDDKPLILGYEHNWDNPWYPEKLLRNPEASRYIAGTSFHCYAGDRDLAQGAIQGFFPNKGIWFTECTGVTNFPNFHDNLGFNMHNLLIGSVREGARSVVLWNMALDQNDGPVNGNGCHTCRGVVTVDWSTTPATVRYEVEYYSLGQSSKLVVPGAHRIESNIAGPIENVAYQNPDGSIVLVVYNSGHSNNAFSVNWHGKVFTYTVSDGSVATFKWDPAAGPDFAVAASPASQTIPVGEETDFQITLNRYHDFDSQVEFSVSGLPSGASAKFDDGDVHDDHSILSIHTSAVTPPGTYPITITASNDSSSEAATIQLKLGPQPTPFGGTPWPIPGLIQAEDFDTGGEGIAYHDIDFFGDIEGGVHRPTESVDIENASDVGGGFDVAFTQPGGWMQYTVNVANSGVYSVNARVAFQGNGGLFHVEFDSLDQAHHDRDHDGHDGDRRVVTTGMMHVPDTHGFQNYVTVTSRAVRLEAGEYAVKIVFDSKGDRGGVGNFNWVDVEPVIIGQSTPFHGTPTVIPGKIEAEDFDNGGQGVAYYDESTFNQGGQYRISERVGIEGTSDVGGGFDVGFTSPGEWLGYTVNVTTAGTYTLHVRIASQPPGGTFHFAVDGHNFSGPITLFTTGDWQIWQTINVPGVNLPAGVHVLQLVMDTPGFFGGVGNFNWFSFD